ncbi:hypothetical protein [Salinimonas lutimaris]|uniref:hypothetical protein n=1 Tax=Salinimonas lutimaris TaxID=914153 RepID=UPI0010C11739|nr:hypothetical protein [Salinimonas lutimaris]
MKEKLLSLCLVSFLSGCAGVPTQQEVANADYGVYPSSHESVVKNYYMMTLKDPASAQYQRVSNPQKTWLGNRIDGVTYGYLVCVTLNAKNSFGAYTGYQTDGLLIRNGKVAKYIEDGNWWGRQIC